MEKPLPDVIAPGLDVLFCGINPSLMSAARGHHFARPGNRFWPALHLAGLTPRRFTPDEDRELLGHGLGMTNIAARPTRAAAELTPDELATGAAALAAWSREYRPRVLAVLGITAWRIAFDRPRAVARRAAGADRQGHDLGAAQPERAQRPLPTAGPGAQLRAAQAARPQLIRPLQEPPEEQRAETGRDDGQQRDPQARGVGEDADQQRRQQESDPQQPVDDRQPGAAASPGSSSAAW